MSNSISILSNSISFKLFSYILVVLIKYLIDKIVLNVINFIRWIKTIIVVIVIFNDLFNSTIDNFKHVILNSLIVDIKCFYFIITAVILLINLLSK